VIVAVAQIVINTADADAAAKGLEARGYTRTFAERGLANHSAKAHLQAAARTRLDLLHLTPPQPGPAIEVTAYDGTPAGRAAYEWDGTTVTATVSDAAASRAFWTGLGFRDGELLEFPGPLPSMRLALALRERPDAEPATVDADGCVLVTLLSTDVETDAAGADTWTETIDGRELRIGMIRGPGGEPVEILQLPKART
jgi:hypothetical protein